MVQQTDGTMQQTDGIQRYTETARLTSPLSPSDARQPQ